MGRAFVYDTLSTFPGLAPLVQDRIFQQGSVLTAQTVKPYLVFTMGNNTDEGYSDLDSFRPARQFFQVFIHDEVGDYARIDEIVKQLKQAFLAAPVSGDVCGVQYLETSADHDDPTLASIMRYVRFQLAVAR